MPGGAEAKPCESQGHITVPKTQRQGEEGQRRGKGYGGNRVLGTRPLTVPGKEPPHPFSLPTGSPRMWSGVGRAKRNLLVLWLTVWRRMDDTQFHQAARVPP